MESPWVGRYSCRPRGGHRVGKASRFSGPLYQSVGRGRRSWHAYRATASRRRASRDYSKQHHRKLRQPSAMAICTWKSWSKIRGISSFRFWPSTETWEPGRAGMLDPAASSKVVRGVASSPNETGAAGPYRQVLCKTLCEIGYANAGTIEFLMDEDRQAAFHRGQRPHPGASIRSRKWLPALNW